MPGLNVAFFVRHFTERGTEVAIYDYAHYNETILGNKSWIVCFTPRKQAQMGWPAERASFEKFRRRFEIIEIDDIVEMARVIQEQSLSFFYTLTHGGHETTYQFNNRDIWGSCKTIKHCVFNTAAPDGDFYISISKLLSQRGGKDIPVIPHIVSLPNNSSNLRDALEIPAAARIIGRYGGFEQFSLSFVKEFIRDYVDSHPNIYFLFMNTSPFSSHPQIRYLPQSIDVEYKVAFINTCDAMIHARAEGETFGLSIAEFSIKNKPIITSSTGETEHLEILKEKAIVYNNKEDLVRIFDSLDDILCSRSDWNAYERFNPEAVMRMFDTMIFHPVIYNE
jgi:hypothetical protein